MQLVTLREPMALVGGTTLPAGRWVMEDVTAGQVLYTAQGQVSQVATVDGNNFSPGVDWDGWKVLLVRSGGFGDLLFLSPLTRELKREWPGMELHVATHPAYAEFAKLLPGVDGVVEYPMRAHEWWCYEGRISLEGVIEWGGAAEERNYVDLVLSHVLNEVREGIDKGLSLEMERWQAPRWPARWLDGPEKPVVAVQLTASARCRTPSSEWWVACIRELRESWCRVVCLDAPRKTRPPHPREDVWMACCEEEPLSMVESCGVLGACDGFIGPDSALLHVAGALGVPAVGLYGPFPWQLRTLYAESIRSFNGKAPCAPCFHHDRTGPWPKGQPCEAAGRCVALDEIDVKRVVKDLRRRMEHVRA